MRTLAFIPARGGSKRIPQKNIKDFCGRPLVGWTVQFAQNYSLFDTVHVSTDSPEIAETVRKQGLSVPFLRSPETADDTSSTASAIIETLRRFSEIGQTFDLVAVLQPTTPYRRTERWDAAFAALGSKAVDSAVSAGQCTTHPWHTFTVDGDGCAAFFFEEGCRQSRTQDMPEALTLNGSLYLTRTNSLLDTGQMITERCHVVVCTDRIENLDIDTLDDWDKAEQLCAGVLAE